MSNKPESWKNLENYRQGKEQLKHAIVSHPEESKNSIESYIRQNINRTFWVSQNLKPKNK